MTPEEVRKVFEELYKENLSIIESASILDYVLPNLQDTWYGDGQLKKLPNPFPDCKSYYGDFMSFNGLMVYNVTIANRFKYLGGIPQDKGEKYNPEYLCHEWYTYVTNGGVRPLPR